MKKFAKLCSAILILFVVLTASALAAEVLYSGTCGGEGDGSNLTWTLDDEGTLRIEGNGEMENYWYDSPWYNYRYRSSIKSAVIGEGVTSIGSCAFFDCSGLTSVTIPEGVTSIDKYAFRYCSSLTSVTIPKSVTSIGDLAFDCCRSLTSVTIPEGVWKIEDSVFSYCSSLTSVIILEGVTSIGSRAFYNCSLTSVTIPESVTSIKDWAFSGCTNLKDVYYPGTEEEWKNIFIGSNNYCLTDATIHYNATVLTPSVTRTAGGTVYKVSAANLPVSSVVVVALYKDGRFVGYESAVYNGETLEIAADTPHDTATILAWSDLEKLIPLAPGTKIGS